MTAHKSPMRHFRRGALLALAGFPMLVMAQTPSPSSTTPITPRPTQATGAPYDVELSKRVREALFNDRTLSVEAKNNIEISTSAGVSTIRGTVRNSSEVDRIISTVRQVTGRDAVNGLTTSMRATE